MLIDIEIQSKKANFTIRVKVGFVLTEYIWYTRAEARYRGFSRTGINIFSWGKK